MLTSPIFNQSVFMSSIIELNGITKKILDEYIETTNKFLETLEPLNSSVILDEFGSVLLTYYQVLMHDILPSSQLLAKNIRLISFSTLCRSFFETIIQLKWILNLPETEKNKAIILFLEFEGVGINSKGKYKHEWYDLVENVPEFSYRRVALDLGLDSESIPFEVSKIVLPKGKENMSIYDYLSKITHLNPKFLSDFVGLDKNKKVTFKPLHYTQCILSCMTFVNCIAIFFDIFFAHYYKEIYNEKNKKIQSIQQQFEKFIQSCYPTINQILSKC